MSDFNETPDVNEAAEGGGVAPENSGFDLDSAIDSVAEKVLKGPEPAPETPSPAPETPPVPAGKSLPKTWKREMEAHWAKLPPEVHEYVYNREADVMRGIQQYQQGYKQWEAVTKPFAQILQQNPQLNPVEAVQSLMHAHLQLSNGTPEQKQRAFQKLVSDYGLQNATQIANGAGEPNPLQDEVSRLRQELQSLKSGFTASQKQLYDSAVSEQRKTVDSFFSDPKNEFAEEVQNDILRLIQTGVAGDLASAYEQACWLNPGVRAKLLAKQQAASSPQTPTQPAGKVLNVESDPNAQPGKRRKAQTIDDTINEIVAKYANSF